MPSRIVIISTDISLTGGGLATLSRLVIQSLSAYCKDHHIELVLWSLKTCSDYTSDIPVRYFDGNQLRLAIALWGTLLERPQPILIATHFGPMRALSFFPKLLHPLTIIVLSGVEVWRTLSYDRKLTLQKATKLLANSHYTRQRAYQHNSWLPPIEVLHLALEAQLYHTQPLDDDLLSRLGSGFILIVARLDATQRHKGHDALIDAMPDLLDRIPTARLVITGRGSDFQRLQGKVQAYHLQESVIFTGFVNTATLNALFDRCRVFVMLSKNDGFGFVYLEAMNYSKPCIALQNSSGAEIIEDGITGLLVEPDNSSQLVTALERFLTDEDFAQECGQRGYQRLQTHFNPTIFTERITAHLDELLQTDD